MNTATMKHYIDFASASGFPYMLIDAGWAAAPNRTGPEDYANLADITHVTPEIDMPELVRYAKEKNVKIWLWSHWTSVDKYMDQAFPLFEQWGIAGVKIDFMNRDDQWMVGFYHRVVESAAGASSDDRFPWRVQARRSAADLSEPDDAGRRDGQGVSENERAHESGAQCDAALYTHAGRAHGLHAGRVWQQQPRELCGSGTSCRWAWERGRRSWRFT